MLDHFFNYHDVAIWTYTCLFQRIKFLLFFRSIFITFVLTKKLNKKFLVSILGVKVIFLLSVQRVPIRQKI